MGVLTRTTPPRSSDLLETVLEAYCMGLFGKGKQKAREEQAGCLKVAVEKGSLSSGGGEEGILS